MRPEEAPTITGGHDADTFKVVAAGKNVRKMAAAIRKSNARGRAMAVFQMPNANQTFIY
jgi:hypothetical protein